MHVCPICERLVHGICGVENEHAQGLTDKTICWTCVYNAPLYNGKNAEENASAKEDDGDDGRNAKENASAKDNGDDEEDSKRHATSKGAKDDGDDNVTANLPDWKDFMDRMANLEQRNQHLEQRVNDIQGDVKQVNDNVKIGAQKILEVEALTANHHE